MNNRFARYIRRTAAVLLVLSLCMLPTGCQLALDREDSAPDRFVGFSVRLTDPFSDDPATDRRQSHEVDGQKLIIFTSTENGETFIASDAGEWLGDVHMHVKTTDESEQYLLSGVLSVCEEAIPSGCILQAEHVYQRSDGSMYAVKGGSSFSGSLGGLEIRVSESSKITGSDGSARELFCEVTLTVEADLPLISARLTEIGEDGVPLAAHDLTGTEKEIWLSPEAEWALLEETMKDGSVRRTAVNAPLDEATVELLLPEENGILIPFSCTLRRP